jgi:hypothetical protein
MENLRRILLEDSAFFNTKQATSHLLAEEVEVPWGNPPVPPLVQQVVTPYNANKILNQIEILEFSQLKASYTILCSKGSSGPAVGSFRTLLPQAIVWVC